MPLELWFAFVVASCVLLVVPGPTVMLVVSTALARGRGSAWATVPGVALGDFTAVTASLLGAGAVLAASASLFTAMKLIGAAYLVWLGIKLWRTKPQLEETQDLALPRSRRAMFWQAYVVTALNPKGIVFFVAFLPQFVSPAQPVVPQFALLGATFIVLATVIVGIWALLAGSLRARLRRPATLRLVNRLGGSFLIGAGILTAAVRRQV
jgi:threonine/homoserine/homoserine lactone efflux protein